MNPLLKLGELGQNIWLDDLRRGIITSGELKDLIERDGIRGITSNPSIFDKAITGSHDYDNAVKALALQGKSKEEIYDDLTIEDIRDASDLLRPFYDQSQRATGFVSLEVNPHLARDVEGTLVEARRLWNELDRHNVFIKVPATKEGLTCIRRLISEGINVNVTLLFGLPRYREVAEAYILGLEDGLEKGVPVEGIASVASFFLSRIDVLVDSLLQKTIEQDEAGATAARGLLGSVAVASAKQAYAIYREIFGGKRFLALREAGARPQRVLWASTSTKNPDYSDVKYVEALIGPETVNTVPQETLDAYRDHGDPAPRLERGLSDARQVLDRLDELGIDLDQVTRQLEDEGIEKFNKPYDDLMSNLEEKRAEALREAPNAQSLELGNLEDGVHETLMQLETSAFGKRLWEKDPTLWSDDSETGDAIRGALGWLHVAGKMAKNVKELKAFAKDVKDAGFQHVVHMGMGGSSLAPLAFKRIFPQGTDGLPLSVLDTTDPATVREMEDQAPLEKTLFIVASKSGTTAEPLAFGDFFYSKVEEIKGDKAGENFVVITDPSSPLANRAQERSFRRIFLNYPDIGGRYSALSYFGLVPAALYGLDVEGLLLRALRMAHACRSGARAEDNPGLVLGAVLGHLARQGRDKITLLLPDALSPLGMWIEQLLAESTGKEGKGMLPVAGELAARPSIYGSDRVFVHMRLKREPDEILERTVSRIRESDQPVVTIDLEDREDLGQEFFRWETAVAVAGAILTINPFDQPNVRESKENTNELLRVVSETGRLPEEQPSLTEPPLALYGGSGESSVGTSLFHFFSQARRGDYVAFLAYLTEERATENALRCLCRDLQEHLHVATTVGYGPRYLHSTGQYHKGGPDTGLFVLLTAEHGSDRAISGRAYGFSAFNRAQAQGDFQALRKRGRRILRIDLGNDVGLGLARLNQAIGQAFAGGRPS